MSKHTPGPWRVIGERRPENRHETDPADLVISSDYGIVADVSGLCYGDGAPRPSEDTVEANANLIAAAPELYEAAKRAEAWFSTPTEDYPPEEASSDIVDALRNALAKAEGE